MKKLLIITYNFPPRHDIASMRARGLARFLPEFGCEPVFLTPALPGKPEENFRVIETFYPGNATVLFGKRLGLNLENRETQDKFSDIVSSVEWKNPLAGMAVWLLKSIIEYPDNQKAWYTYAVEAGLKLLAEEKVDVMISSSPPATAHLIGSEIKRRHNIPWIADFRDLWSQDHYRTYGPIRKWMDKRLELRTMPGADAMITVSEPLSRNLSVLHGGKKVYTIPNGFDPADMATQQLAKEFTITYTGKFMEGKRDPTLLFQALEELIRESRIDPADVKVRLFGRKRRWIEREIKSHGLEGVVSQMGLMGREECLEKQRSSQLLLLINWNDPRDEGVYTGKVFEYLAAKRPVLAIGGPRGVISDLMEETCAGTHVTGLDELKKALTGFYDEYKRTGKVQYHGIEEKLMRYSHREMARKFAQVIEDVSGGSR